MSTLKTMSDEELALAYIDGNNRAFDELLTRNQEKIFTYIMYVVKDEDLANDLFQETFLKVITKLQNHQYADSGKFLWWLTRIAHNVIIDYYRAQKSDKVVDAPRENDLSNLRSDNVIDGNRENELSNAQVLKDVKRLMDALPEAQRDVVYMRFYQELSFKEIAKLTNVSINTSLGRMRYALINLRKLTLEDIAATDKHIDTRCHQSGGRLTLYPTIDFNQGLTAFFFNHPTQTLYLVNRVLDELLPSESRIHTHQQNHFHIADDIFKHGDWCRRIQGDASLHASIMNLLNRTMQMYRSLIMYIHHHSTKFCSLFDISLRALYHVMNVQWFLTNLCYSF